MSLAQRINEAKEYRHFVELINWYFGEDKNGAHIIKGNILFHLAKPKGALCKSKAIKGIRMEQNHICVTTKNCVYICRYGNHSEDLKDLTLYRNDYIRLLKSTNKVKILFEKIQRETELTKLKRMKGLTEFLAKEEKAVLFSFSSEKDLCADWYLTKANSTCEYKLYEIDCFTAKARHKDLSVEFSPKVIGPKEKGDPTFQRIITVICENLARDVAVYLNNAGLCDLDFRIGSIKAHLRSGQTCKLELSESRIKYMKQLNNGRE